MKLVPVQYDELNAKQKENYNYQKLSAVLADYGFVTLRLSDDWGGADFIAVHVQGETLRVQLKTRLGFFKTYENKNLHIAFAEGRSWYLYPHDDLLNAVLAVTNIANTSSWKVDGRYHFPQVPSQIRPLLEQFRVQGTTEPMIE